VHVVLQPGLGLATNVVSLQLTVPDVDAWYPNEYGAQPLYALSVAFTPTPSAGDAPLAATLPAGSWTGRIGFRTVELVQDPAPGGTTFYFRVNGVPVFIKGANWVPADAFEGRVTDATLLTAFEAFTDAHFNTLRNWGGGVYQSDTFYDLADELGLLVWEEAMFACSLYPNDTSFLANVAAEIADNVQRLAAHPSVLLWAGSNENEAALAFDWYGIAPTAPAFPTYVGMYASLYWDTVLPTVWSLDQSRPTLGSSPSNGNESQAAPVHANPNMPLAGDMHFYDYTDDPWVDATFPTPRFASEFGYQSWPSLLTLAAASSEAAGDWAWLSPFMNHRQHHPDGQAQITALWALHFDNPNRTASNATLFGDWLWLSQASAGLAMKFEAEHYRRGRSSGSATTGGYTMGTLYWQANDIWEGASWSAIEYGGRWKVLQHLATRFYADVLVSPALINNSVLVSVVTDVADVANATLLVRMWAWTGGQLAAWTFAQDVTVPAGSAAVVASAALDAFLAQGACPSAPACVATFELWAGDTLLADNELYLASFNAAPAVRVPRLNATVAPAADPDGTLSVTVASLAPAPAPVAPLVWLETPLPGRWSDNAFLFTGAPLALTFYPAAGTAPTPSQLADGLQVLSLWDRYDWSEAAQ
jgi:beta-mannosidase